MNPLVSIIIPVYNNEKYIAETIESALAQSWANKEIIIVDDGSSDTSNSIARSYEGNASLTVYTCTNNGSAAARNIGFQKSKGDYIQYLDADDLMSPDKITNQLELLSGFSTGYISSCPWGMFTNDISEASFITQGVWKDYSAVDWLVTAWKGGGMMQTACWLTPRHLIEKAGPWNEDLKKNPNDDGEFFCRVLLKSEGIKFCEPSKVYYRCYEGPRVSKGKTRLSVQSLLGTCISYEDNLLAVDRSEKAIDAVVTNYADFIYQFYGYFPDLALIAEYHIKRLGFSKPPVVGGESFKKLANVIGFKNALKLKGWVKILS
jgi:glycosyltransferase involved in cell wall biosynthesis